MKQQVNFAYHLGRRVRSIAPGLASGLATWLAPRPQVSSQSSTGPALADWELDRMERAQRTREVFASFGQLAGYLSLAWLAMVGLASLWALVYALPYVIEFLGIQLGLVSGLSNLVYDLAYTPRGDLWLIQLERLMFVAASFWLVAWLAIFRLAKTVGLKSIAGVQDANEGAHDE
jgi:hypothetical protein